MKLPAAKYALLDTVRVKKRGPIRRLLMGASARKFIGQTGLVAMVDRGHYTNEYIYMVLFNVSSGEPDGCSYFEKELELVAGESNSK